jgi:hypothetical protein
LALPAGVSAVAGTFGRAGVAAQRDRHHFRYNKYSTLATHA